MQGTAVRYWIGIVVMYAFMALQEAWADDDSQGKHKSIDHAPTILEYLDIDIPNRFQGTSVLGRVRGNTQSKTEIHFEKDIQGEVADIVPDPDRRLLWAVRDNEYKYIQFADESIPPLLFDLCNDPGEYHNLAEDPKHLKTVLKYCQKLLRWRMKNEDQRMAHWYNEHK